MHNILVTLQGKKIGLVTVTGYGTMIGTLDTVNDGAVLVKGDSEIWVATAHIVTLWEVK